MSFQIIPILTKSELLKSFTEISKVLQKLEFVLLKTRISGKGSFSKNNLEKLLNMGKAVSAANTSDVPDNYEAPRQN